MLRFRTLTLALVLAVCLVAALPLWAQDSTATGAPAGAEQLVALWAAGLAFVTAALTQVLKKVTSPIANAPDWLKAMLALVVAFASTKAAVLFGAPIPGDLQGFAGVVVNWAAAMGIHALAKKVGVVTDAPALSAAVRR